MDKRVFITEEEKEKCRRVADAYSEMYDITDVLVVDAGRYGFVKLQYFNAKNGFEETTSFLDSQIMFDDLWYEWEMMYLLDFVKGTPMAELEFEDMFRRLPEDKKKELSDKKAYFARLAGIDL